MSHAMDSPRTGAAPRGLPEGERRFRVEDRRQTEAAAYLKNILNGSTLVAIIATDLDGLITLFNRGAERMLGYTAEEMVGRHSPAILHLPEEVASRGHELSSLLGRTVAGFDVFVTSIGRSEYDHLEWTYLRKDKRRISVTLSLSAVLDEAGNPIGYLGMAEDVTARREAARNTIAAYTQLNAVLECMSDCVMTIGRDWRILYGNHHTMEALPDFEVGRIYWECFPSVIGSSSEVALRNAMENRIAASYERFFEPYGTWFKVRLFPSEVGVTAFFANITEEKKMQEQIAMEQVLREKRIEALNHMAGGLAHEISNPLAIIHARASDLEAAVEAGLPITPEEIAKASASIVTTADRAMRILRGLRGFAREAGKDPMEWASIHDLVEQCVELLGIRFEHTGIELRVDLAAEIPLVLCRETQIGQILTNLLNNAFDAIEHSCASQRWVALTAAAAGANIVVRVTDSGPGVDDTFRPCLIEPFFTTRTKGLGMGVGLSLSRAIAQDHGGDLSLCKDGGYTCFELVLPIDPTITIPG